MVLRIQSDRKYSTTCRWSREPYGFASVAKQHPASKTADRTTAAQLVQPRYASTALPNVITTRHARNIKTPPCRLVQSAVKGIKAHSQLVRFRESECTSHMHAGRNSSVNKCGRARKCIDAARTATKVRSMAINPSAPSHSA